MTTKTYGATATFPVFTAAALAMIVMNIAGFTAISWWVIAAVWLAPLAIILALVGFGLITAAVVFAGVLLAGLVKGPRRRRYTFS